MKTYTVDLRRADGRWQIAAAYIGGLWQPVFHARKRDALREARRLGAEIGAAPGELRVALRALPARGCVDDEGVVVAVVWTLG